MVTVEVASQLPTAVGEPLRHGDRDVERLLTPTIAGPDDRTGKVRAVASRLSISARISWGPASSVVDTI
jgi:hypothetical protein